MNPNTEQAFRDHAIAEFPRECCGLIVVVKGKERYMACRNVAVGQEQEFVMHPDDLANAEDAGEIIGVAHSHPNGLLRMSIADKVMCNAAVTPTPVPWWIATVKVPDGGDAPEVTGIGRFEPDGYEAPLVGREFIHGVLDCYTLIQDWFKRERDIELPHFERQDKWWEKGDDLYMEHFREAGFEPMSGAIQEGDVILMQMRSPVPNHGAVYIGNGIMLHHMYRRLSTREVYGGSYLENTRIIVRHKSLQK